MNNDYKKSDFWIKYNNDNKQYYIRVNNHWIEVSQDVYHICRSSYMKMHRDLLKNTKRNTYYDENSCYELSENIYTLDPINIFHRNEQARMLQSALLTLTEEERFIIQGIYWLHQTESEVGEKLGISQQLVNYKKKKILNKLKTFLLNQI